MEEETQVRTGWDRNVCAFRKYSRCLQKYSFQVFLKVVVLWVSNRKHSTEENMGNGYRKEGNFVMFPCKDPQRIFHQYQDPHLKAPAGKVYSLGMDLHGDDTKTTLHQRHGSYGSFFFFFWK